MELNSIRSKSNSKYEQAYCDDNDELEFEQPSAKLVPAALNAEENRIISKAAQQLRLQESLRVAKIDKKRVFISDCKNKKPA